MILVSAKSRQPTQAAWTEEHLFQEHSIALRFAIEPSTSMAYDSHLNLYITFCQFHHCPTNPTQDTLSYDIVWLSHNIEPQLVDNYLSGIANRLELLYPEVCNTRRSPLVSRTLQGQKPVPYDDTLFLTMLVTGFETLQQLGELTWPDAIKLQTYRKVPLHHTIYSTSTSIQYSLPYQKNDSLRTGSTIVILRELLKQVNLMVGMREVKVDLAWRVRRDRRQSF
ncbi:hypothetical protein BDR04DRAFT_1013624 [Suillus decipiens]|nr:hypothetical protein BDR04DRAFT_1013624 [Suillus decipiens]